jgi:hypothetical protein
LLGGHIERVLDSLCVVAVTVASGTSAASAQEATGTKVLILRLGLGVVLSVVKQALWSTSSSERSLEFLWPVGGVLVALTPALNSGGTAGKYCLTVTCDSDRDIVKLDVLHDQLTRTDRQSVAFPGLRIVSETCAL